MNEIGKVLRVSLGNQWAVTEWSCKGRREGGERKLAIPFCVCVVQRIKYPYETLAPGGRDIESDGFRKYPEISGSVNCIILCSLTSKLVQGTCKCVSKTNVAKKWI